MADRVLVRLLLRVAGLVLMATGLPALAGTLSNLVAAMFPATPLRGAFFSQGYMIQMGVYSVAQLLQCLFGLYLLFRGKRVIDLCTRGLAGCCFDCGYDLTGHTREACPECGAVIPPSQRAKLGTAETGRKQGGSDAPSVES